MKKNDNIEELFSEKLGDFESPVRPELWTNISSQLGSATTGAVGGVSVLSKVIIGTVTVAAITTATVVMFNLTKSTTETSANDPKVTLSETHKSVVEDEDKNTSDEKNTPENNTIKQEEQQEGSIENDKVEREIPQLPNYQTDISPITTNDSKEIEPSIVPPMILEETDTNKRTEKSVVAPVKEVISPPVVENETEKELTEAYSLGTLPNIFTPNGDGKNDYFFIESTGLSNFTIVVLNEKQQAVYESSDVNFKWDGTTLQGEPIATGNYSYYFIATDKNGNTVKKFMKLAVYR